MKSPQVVCLLLMCTSLTTVTSAPTTVLPYTSNTVLPYTSNTVLPNKALRNYAPGYPMYYQYPRPPNPLYEYPRGSFQYQPAALEGNTGQPNAPLQNINPQYANPMYQQPVYNGYPSGYPYQPGNQYPYMDPYRYAGQYPYGMQDPFRPQYPSPYQLPFGYRK